MFITRCYVSTFTNNQITHEQTIATKYLKFTGDETFFNKTWKIKKTGDMKHIRINFLNKEQ